MRVYHFTKQAHGLSNIRLRRVKVAEIEDLNDPFELRALTARDATGRQALDLQRAELAKFTGILCFTNSWRSPVMWSHYAEGHCGLCLGFDVPVESLVKVSYSPKRIEADFEVFLGGGAYAEAAMSKALTTKYSHWRYEREWRAFVGRKDRDADSGLYFMDFSAGLQLKEVIVGHRSTVSQSEVADALGELGQSVSVIKARLAFRSFNVVRQRNRSLWK